MLRRITRTTGLHRPSSSSSIGRALRTTSIKSLLPQVSSQRNKRTFFSGGQKKAFFGQSGSPWWKVVAGLGLAAGVTYATLETAHACGIVAFVGKKDSANNYLLEGLHILQNRGYDSAGMATINPQTHEISVTKYASVGSTSDSIDLLKKHATSHEGDTVGIAHTRWATHGGKTDANAHPHMDYKNRIALVHNGTIENSGELKEELEKHGIKFRSETDTEVIAQLIGHYLDKQLPLLDAVKQTLGRLEGTWGLAIISKDWPDQVIAARNGSPLVIGLGADRMFVASELSAFCRHTQNYISLNDGEIAVVRANGTDLDLSRVEKAPEMEIEMSPAPYPHWTIKEIMEQPAAIARTLGYGGRFTGDGLVKLGGLQAHADLLLGVNHLMIAACGTSLFAAGYAAQIMRSLRCFDTVQPIDAAEVTPDAFPLKAGGLLVVSQSGETKDTHRSLVVADNLMLPSFSVVNQVGSLIARTTNCGVYLNAGREHAVASTKAFTTQVAAMALVAGWFNQNRTLPSQHSSQTLQRRAELIEALHRLPTYTGMALKTRDQVRELAKKLASKDHMFILGKGYAEPIAREGALKIKEISYIHAEGFSGGALKHGPFALLEKGTPVVLLILNDQHAELMRIAAAEVRARDAYTIVITDKPSLANGVADEVINIPSNGPLTALLGVVPLQLLAYEISLARGINPDKPRHLAKAVTVD